VIALSRDERDQYGEGTLSLVDNQIDQTTGTVRLKATFANADLALWPGQFVNARLLLRTQRNVVTVPSDAVQRGAQGMYAYVVKPDSTVALQPLKVGLISGGVAVIESGVEEGQRAVVAGLYRLQPGASPETMAPSVATPLERQFAQIPGVTQMTSTSALGSTSVTVQFDLARDIDAAAQDIQAAINAAGGQLPKNLPNPPTYRKVNPADSPILIFAIHSDVLPLITVDDYAENILAQQISQITGVAQVSIGGQQKPAVRIQV